MRITRLHIQNLNSLKGLWSIDFTSPEYDAEGIFAITGPTGAGKSTLLDGICLALFGSTPRLGRITKANNEIMSRATGECFAELEFEASGSRYRCHWSQHRARRIGHGELQQHKHEIVDAATGKVLETRVREVTQMVEKLTGLNFDQFTRSIMLAQGKFAAFLNADAGERAPILEQITGTEIYSQISISVHERTTAEKQKTATIHVGIDAVDVMKPEEEHQLRLDLAKSRANTDELVQQLDGVVADIHLLNAVREAEKELEKTNIQKQEFEQRLRREEANLKRYSQGLRAQSVVGEVRRLSSLDERRQLEQKALEDWHVQYELLADRREPLKGEVENKKNQLQEIKAEYELVKPVLNTVRTLDTRLNDYQSLIDSDSAEISECKEELEGERQQLKTIAAIICRTENNHGKLINFLDVHAKDAMLVEHYSDIRTQLGNLAAIVQEQEKGLRELDHLDRQIKETEQRQLTAVNLVQRLLAGIQELEERLAENENSQAELLKDMEPSELHARIEQFAVKEQLYSRISELFSQRDSISKKRLCLAEELRALSEDQKVNRKHLEELEKLEQNQAERIEQLEKIVRLQQRIVDLESERQQLQAGVPCPLCGSPDHPWADEKPARELDHDTLRVARQKQKMLQQSAGSCREKLAGILRAIEYRIKNDADMEEETLTIDNRLLVLKQEVGIPHNDFGTADFLRLEQINHNRLQELRNTKNDLNKQTAIQEDIRRKHKKVSVEHGIAENDLKDERHTLENLKKEQLQKKEYLALRSRQLAEKKESLQTTLSPLGIATITIDNISALIDELGLRKDRWLTSNKKLQEISSELAAQQRERDMLETSIRGLSKTLGKKTEDMAVLTAKQESLLRERKTLFAEKQPDREEDQYRQKVTDAETRLSAAIQEAGELETSIHGLMEKQKVLRANLETTLTACRNQETAVWEEFNRLGFHDMDAFNLALLPEEKLNALAQIHSEIERLGNELDVRLREKTAELANLKARLKNDATSEQLEQQRLKLSGALEEEQQKIGAAAEKSEKNEAAKIQLAQQHDLLIRQQKEEERWNRLHHLIGSADGKKFRVFAQGITFDRVIQHANKHLEKMNDRYILVRDLDQPLELQVIDNYQAGEIRSTRNLSGGESFIVSLALSLGLSSMVSRNIQVDSLFLDEGFGTLDEETLDTALHTLASLHRSGKLIGVISHVPMLRERIGLRIEVRPNADGTSTLAGPGCSRVG